jgi:hypothetical protein
MKKENKKECCAGNGRVNNCTAPHFVEFELRKNVRGDIRSALIQVESICAIQGPPSVWNMV